MKTRHLALVHVLSGGLACLALAACDSAPGFTSKAKSPANAAGATPVGQTRTTAAALPRNAGGPQRPAVFGPNLTVSDRIANACGIAPRGDAKRTGASFEFDSAALSEEDRGLLAEVAKCITDGALRGQRVRLVGRADPRGEPEYNMTLGESRADAVGRYMVDLGVGPAQLNATSRGEIDATGTDEAGWRQDRRVDLELAD